MTSLASAVEQIIDIQSTSGKPLAIVLAGHNGSGKSTMWYSLLADRLQIPLINADRMMISVLPESSAEHPLPKWATHIRDEDEAWMQVAQQAVHGFVVRAMAANVSFAIETVFSHWKELEDGTIESKIDQIRELQAAGYFVLLLFVGLTSAPLSVARVQTRVAMGGHGVKVSKLRKRFPRTQRAIREARAVADATILIDNSRELSKAFTVCRIETPAGKVYDRRESTSVSAGIRKWLDVVCPL